MNPNVNSLREIMVRHQIASRGVKDQAVLQAMSTIPREQFVPEHLAKYAYEDNPLPIDAGQTISQPYIVALMAEAAQLTANDRCLEIGTGSGYSAAVLSHLCKKLYSIERIPELAESARACCQRLHYDNIEIKCGDGTLGWPEHAPYNAIVVTAGAPVVPHALIDQLEIGGRLIIPVGDKLIQELVRLTKTPNGKYEKEVLEIVRFVPLLGEQGWHDRTQG